MAACQGQRRYTVLIYKNHFQGSCGVWKNMEKSLVIFQPGKVWKKFVWSVSMERENNFPNLIF